MKLRSAITLPLIALLWAAPAQGAQPMDRFSRLLGQERYDVVIKDASRWLDKNRGDERVAEVTALLAEAHWQLLDKPTFAQLQDYRARFPAGPRDHDAMVAESAFALEQAQDLDEEQAYLDLIAAYPGTEASAEARELAEAAAWGEALSKNTADGYALFRDRYPQSSKAPVAQDRYLEQLYREARDVGTAESFRALLAEHPDHPRADDIRLGEQVASLRALGDTPTPTALLDFARQYPHGDPGWQALQRMLGGLNIALLQAEGTAPVTTPLLQARPEGAPEGGEAFGLLGLVSATVELPGALPEGVTLTLDVQVRATQATGTPAAAESAEADGATEAPDGAGEAPDGAGEAPDGAGEAPDGTVTDAAPPEPIWLSWEQQAQAWADTWVLPVLGGPPAPQRPPEELWWSTARPLCGPDADGIEGRYVVELKRGEDEQRWVQNFVVQRRCGGPVPLAVRRDAQQQVTALGYVGADDTPRVHELTLNPGGMAWQCQGEAYQDKRGLWLSCNGWELSPRFEGFFIRVAGEGEAVDGDVQGPPPSTSAGGALSTLPAVDGQHWFAVPGSYASHFGEPPPCPLPVGFGTPWNPGGAPDAPAWIPDGVLPELDRADDLDGDGNAERVLRIQVAGTDHAWLVVVPGTRLGTGSWVTPLPADAASGTLPPIRHDGCRFLTK